MPFAAILPVHADEADVFNLRVSESALWDDNLFREADNLKPQADTIFTTTAGVDFNKRVSLQQFVGRVSWVQTNHQKNSYLDAGALHYDGQWNWATGSHLKGELAATRSAAQNSFADFQNLRQRNLRTTETQRFGLDYAFNPTWHVTGGINHLTVTNDQLLTQESDYEATSALLGGRYTPASGTVVSFQTRHTDGRYTKRPFDASPSIQFDNEFTETGQEVAVGWQATGHSAFNGRLEFVERRHAHLGSRDFSGWTGQLGYQYQYSAKTLLSATYGRGLNAFQEESSSYYVSDELVLGSRWDATDKVKVSARLAYSHRQYEGQLATFTGPKRKDDVVRFGVDATYQAARWLEVKAGLASEKRNSNSSGLNYTDRQALLSATARF